MNQYLTIQAIYQEKQSIPTSEVIQIHSSFLYLPLLLLTATTDTTTPTAGAATAATAGTATAAATGIGTASGGAGGSWWIKIHVSCRSFETDMSKFRGSNE